MNRIKKISMEILEIHKEKFGLDFGENKKTLDNISIIRSKELKNELAGFITKFIKHELREIKENEEREKQAQASEEANEEKLPHGQLPVKVNQNPLLKKLLLILKTSKLPNSLRLNLF